LVDFLHTNVIDIKDQILWTYSTLLKTTGKKLSKKHLNAGLNIFSVNLFTLRCTVGIPSSTSYRIFGTIRRTGL